MSNHQFKPGEHAMLEVKIDYVLDDSCIVAPINDSFEVDYGLITFAKKSALHPAPREGEYRLTVEELDAFAYAHHAAKLDIFSNFADKEFRMNWIKQWLDTRKELVG